MAACELRKNGVRVRLETQPFQVLAMLALLVWAGVGLLAAAGVGYWATHNPESAILLTPR